MVYSFVDTHRVPCLICSATISRRNIVRHVRRCHSNPTGPIAGPAQIVGLEPRVAATPTSVIEAAVMNVMAEIRRAPIEEEALASVIAVDNPGLPPAWARDVTIAAITAGRIVANSLFQWIMEMGVSGILNRGTAVEPLSALIDWAGLPGQPERSAGVLNDGSEGLLVCDLMAEIVRPQPSANAQSIL